MTTQSVSSALWRERQEARAQMRPIVHIRISRDAFLGSIVAVPVSPERARTLGKLWAFPDGTVDAAYDGRALELLMHPEDWASLLKEFPHENGHAVQLAMRAGEPDRVMGIPVSKQ